MNPSDITVVIPTYKRPRLLARALESVIAQEVAGLKVHVFDNDSGDETGSVVKAAARRYPIQYHRHDSNIGCSRNIQFSIDSVTTQYCAILNDDDMQLPGLMKAALEGLPKHPTAAAFCGRTAVYDSGANVIHRIQGSGWTPGFYRAGEKTLEMVREHFTPTGVVFTAAALKELRFIWGDMEMMARLADRHDFIVSDKVTGVFVVHPQSWTSSHPPEEDQRVALNRLSEYLQLPSLSTAGRMEAVNRVMQEIAHKQLQYGLAALTNGDRSAERQREVREAARLLNALQPRGEHTGLRAFRSVAASLAGEHTMSPVSVLMLRAARRLSTLLERPGPAAPSEGRAVLETIAELNRRAGC